MLTTHGTRYPTIDEINQIIALTDFKKHVLHNHETRGGKWQTFTFDYHIFIALLLIEGHMCNRDLENLRRWKPDAYTPQRANVLTSQGIEDMKLLARRLQSNFLQLLLPNDSDVLSTNYKVLCHHIP